MLMLFQVKLADFGLARLYNAEDKERPYTNKVKKDHLQGKERPQTNKVKKDRTLIR